MGIPETVGTSIFIRGPATGSGFGFNPASVFLRAAGNIFIDIPETPTAFRGLDIRDQQKVQAALRGLASKSPQRGLPPAVNAQRLRDIQKATSFFQNLGGKSFEGKNISSVVKAIRDDPGVRKMALEQTFPTIGRTPQERSFNIPIQKRITTVVRKKFPKPAAIQVSTAKAPTLTDRSAGRDIIDVSQDLVKVLPPKEKKMGLLDIIRAPVPTLAGTALSSLRTVITGVGAIIPGVVAQAAGQFLAQPGQRLAGPIDLGVDIVKKLSRQTNGGNQMVQQAGRCFTDQFGNVVFRKPRRKRTILSVRDVQGANRVCKVVKKFGFKPKVNTCRKKRSSSCR